MMTLDGVNMIKCKIDNCNNISGTKTIPSLCSTHRQRLKKYNSLERPKIILPEGILKICKIHGELNEDKIIIRKKKSNNVTWLYCKECRSNELNRWRKNNPQRHKLHRFKTHLKKQFGLTLNQYEEMRKEQNYVCKICLKPDPIKRLSVDHCHEMESKGIMKIRGLLCSSCNRAIGLLKESIERIEEVLKYLKAST